MKNIKIDKLLLEISNTDNYQIISEDDFDTYIDFVEYRKILIIMLDDLKIISRPITNASSILLTKFGDEVINQGGWIKYLENEKTKDRFLTEKEQLDFEKSKVDLELSKKMLKEFPKTKWFARIGLIIAIVLALKELYILIKPQL